MEEYHNPYGCPHMLEMFETRICVVTMEKCANVDKCPRDIEEGRLSEND